jgi:hypothetical protein
MKQILTLSFFIITSGIFAQQSGYLFNPFSLEIDPMEGLLLINFENDPDSLYIGFEPQIFNDTVNGTGQLVIGWRVDGRIDVYHDPGLNPDPKKFDIAGKGLAHLVERDLNGGYYRVDSTGVQAFYAFKDLHNREIELSIREQNRRKRKPFGLLAPMGLVAENPSAMPLIFLHDFYFVRRKNTELSIKINGRMHKADKLPLRMDGARMYFTRYSPKPMILMFNPAQDQLIKAVPVQANEQLVKTGDYELKLESSIHDKAIKSITRQHDIHPIVLSFDPAFPDILNMDPDQRIDGTFILEGHPSVGNISGSYLIKRDGRTVSMSVHPSGGWKPRPDKFSLRFLYTVAKDFKRWPKTYEWNATIDLPQVHEHQYHMKSSWIRLE